MFDPPSVLFLILVVTASGVFATWPLLVSRHTSEKNRMRADAHLQASMALRGQGDQTFGEIAALDVMNPDERRTYYNDVVARALVNPQATIVVENVEQRSRFSMLDDIDG